MLIPKVIKQYSDTKVQPRIGVSLVIKVLWYPYHLHAGLTIRLALYFPVLLLWEL